MVVDLYVNCKYSVAILQKIYISCALDGGVIVRKESGQMDINLIFINIC